MWVLLVSRDKVYSLLVVDPVLREACISALLDRRTGNDVDFPNVLSPGNGKVEFFFVTIKQFSFGRVANSSNDNQIFPLFIVLDLSNCSFVQSGQLLRRLANRH